MNTEYSTRISVESIPVGQHIISLHVTDEKWLDDQCLSLFKDTIASIIEDVYKVIPFCVITRLISVSSDFPGEVARWQQELGKPVGVTSGPHGEAHGKVLVWGNEGTDSTFAVIILSELVALSLIEETWLSKAILSHELAHVHDEFEYRRAFTCPPPQQYNTWANVRCALAYNIWSEFSANLIAYRYYKNSGIDDIPDIQSLLSRATRAISERVSLYWINHNIPELWFPSWGDLEQVFAQSARFLGTMTAAQLEDSDRSAEFFAVCDAISSDWGQLIRQLSSELKKAHQEESWDSRKLDALEIVVENGFHLVGLFPEDRDPAKGIWVSVH
jgi:hypothetical protein